MTTAGGQRVLPNKALAGERNSGHTFMWLLEVVTVTALEWLRV